MRIISGLFPLPNAFFKKNSLCESNSSSVQLLTRAAYTWAAFNNVQVSVCLSPLLKNESISVGALEEALYLFFSPWHRHMHTYCTSTPPLDGEWGGIQSAKLYYRQAVRRRLTQKWFYRTVSPPEFFNLVFFFSIFFSFYQGLQNRLLLFQHALLHIHAAAVTH